MVWGVCRASVAICFLPRGLTQSVGGERYGLILRLGTRKSQVLQKSCSLKGLLQSFTSPSLHFPFDRESRMKAISLGLRQGGEWIGK